MTNEEAKAQLEVVRECMRVDKAEDIVEALTLAIKALEQQPSEDCISRQAVNKIINKWLSHSDYELKDHIYDMTKKIHKLPSVTPKPKKGKWVNRHYINDGGYRIRMVICSECGEEYGFDYHTGISMDNYKYCPNCGCQMDGDKEDSE